MAKRFCSEEFPVGTPDSCAANRFQLTEIMSTETVYNTFRHAGYVDPARPNMVSQTSLPRTIL